MLVAFVVKHETSLTFWRLTNQKFTSQCLCWNNQKCRSKTWRIRVSKRTPTWNWRTSNSCWHCRNINPIAMFTVKLAKPLRRMVCNNDLHSLLNSVFARWIAQKIASLPASRMLCKPLWITCKFTKHNLTFYVRYIPFSSKQYLHVKFNKKLISFLANLILCKSVHYLQI